MNPNTPDDLELLRRLRRLPRERDPSRDLWHGIEARLAPANVVALPPRRRPALWLALAAAALAFALVLPQRNAGPGSDPVPASLAARSTDAASGTGQALRREADALTLEYQVALQPFEDAPLPPSLQAAAIELDASARELRLALREQPEAPYLLERLRHTYGQRLKLAQRGALG